MDNILNINIGQSQCEDDEKSKNPSQKQGEISPSKQNLGTVEDKPADVQLEIMNELKNTEVKRK